MSDLLPLESPSVPTPVWMCFLPPSHPCDGEHRARAEARATAWMAKIAHLQAHPMRNEPGPFRWFSGDQGKPNSNAGSNQTVDVPLAGGPLRSREKALCEELGFGVQAEPRLYLNCWYLGAGLPKLREMLDTGLFALEQPEESITLVIAWLLDQGRDDAATSMLDTIAPYLSHLRFYPFPSDEPPSPRFPHGVRNMVETREVLQAIGASQRTTALRASIRVWLPLFDRIVSLFAETRDAQGKPCQHWPQGWRERAAETAQAVRGAGLMPHRRHFLYLFRILEIAVDDPARMTGRHVGRVRLILGDIERKRGLPGDARHEAVRSRQRAEASRPSQQDLARVVVKRLESAPSLGALSELEPWVRPVTEEEAASFGITPGYPISALIRSELERSLDAPLEELAARGVFREPGDMLYVFDEMRATVQGEQFEDERLRRVFAALLQAEHVVSKNALWKFENKSWFQMLVPFTKADSSAAMRAFFTRFADVIVQTFPHKPTPQGLPAEIYSAPQLEMLNHLAERADATLPAPAPPPPSRWAFWQRAPSPTDPPARIPLATRFTEHDLCGFNSAGRLHAAKLAGALLADTPYARYYDIDYTAVEAIHDLKRINYEDVSARFLDLCTERAKDGKMPPRCRAGAPGAADGRPLDKAKISVGNAEIYEQAEVLSASGVVFLFAAFDLQSAQPEMLERLSQRCFTWICRRLAKPVGKPYRKFARCTAVSRAWRMMLFYQSLIRPSRFDAFTQWVREALARQPAQLVAILEPYVNGLHTGHPQLLAFNDPALMGLDTVMRKRSPASSQRRLE